MNQHVRDARTERNTKQIWELYKKQREKQKNQEKEHKKEMKQLLKGSK